MNTASVSTLLNGARKTGCVHEDRGADGHGGGNVGCCCGIQLAIARGRSIVGQAPSPNNEVANTRTDHHSKIISMWVSALLGLDPMYDATGPDGRRQHTVAEIAEAVGVHRTTVYDYLNKEG